MLKFKNNFFAGQNKCYNAVEKKGQSTPDED